MTTQISEPLRPSFREYKAIDAASRLLCRAGGRMSRSLFVGLMYLVDRESLVDRGVPVFCDYLYAMKDSPTVAHTVNRIYGLRWAEHIQPHGRGVILVAPSAGDSLSDYEDRLIDSLFDEAGSDAARLRKRLRALPEWNGSYRPIDHKDILIGGGWSDHAAEAALEEMAEVEQIERMLDD